uniref:Cytochrome c oxidase subunit 3 n=1 Tax=Metagonimus yokogawai TaxID=84529 RepID=V9ND95_9TREM|nr:cytochrome c oxidase subunit III [Metagonimus yokogawai]AGN12756.1 cytochrome c oxidase subunit III [Metagonimus yokogawai]
MKKNNVSWSALVAAIGSFIGLVGIFLWALVVVAMVPPFMFVWLGACAVCEILEPIGLERYSVAFWLLIVTEVVLFVCLLGSVSWNNEGSEVPLSDCLGWPLLGCVLLLSSSLTATAYHHCYSFWYSKGYLFLSIVLGIGFLCVQIVEFYTCECDHLQSWHYSAAFFVVGLHFLHVLAGVVAMILLLKTGSSKHRHYTSIVVWYWHFVDYVWLWVYLLVYFV